MSYDMQEGIMQTNDEETRRFFKHSSVQVLLCPRSAGEGHSWAKSQVKYGYNLLNYHSNFTCYLCLKIAKRFVSFNLHNMVLINFVEKLKRAS